MTSRRRPVISLCMIVRDEEEFLDACLHSVRGVADEIVVLDTGSTDRTPDIAKSHGARVYSHPWNDSYSEARNAAIDLAGGEWILILDADERLDEVAKSIVLGAVRQSDREAFYLSQRNYYSDDETSDVIINPTCRLWRNRPQYRYEGRVHENPATSILNRGAAIANLDAVIHHYGNQPRVIANRDKCARYIGLLEAELRDSPDDASKLHDIAISHYVSGRFDQALPYLERASSLVQPHSALAGLVFSTLIGALYHAGETDCAVAALERAQSLGIRHPEIHYVGGQALMALERYEDAARHFGSAISLGSEGNWTGDSAVWGHKAHEALAICLLRLGRCSQAAEHGIEALQAKPERVETRAIVAEACFRLGDAAYESGDYPAAANLYSNALNLAPDHAPGFFTLGNCYFRLGVVEAAVLAYRKALELDADYAEAAHNLSLAEEQIGNRAA